jgi:hypothetical protein
MSTHERRGHDRLLCAGLVSICWRDEAGEHREAVVNLDDLSPGGACLHTEFPISEGTELLVGERDLAHVAYVRHCTAVQLGWLIGIQFGPEADPGPDICQPTHLLDPAAIPIDPELRNRPVISQELRDTIACLMLDTAMQEAEPESEG